MKSTNKWKRTIFATLFFLTAVFYGSARMRAQEAGQEERTLVFENGEEGGMEIRTADAQGGYAMYTVLDKGRDAGIADEIEDPVWERQFCERNVVKIDPDAERAWDGGHTEDNMAIGKMGSKKGASQGGEITLYVLDKDYQKYISIPDGYLQSYSLSGHTYGAVKGESIKVEGQCIVPVVETWYYHQIPDSGWWVGQTSPSGQEGEVAKEQYIYKDASLVIDGKTVTFHIRDYAQMYSEQVMDQYLKSNIQSEMTDYEKAEKCCQFVAGYDYGTDHTSYTGMIVTGSGDCWASVSALRYMFDKLGIKSRSRAETTAASGHRKVVAILDGYYYFVDVGYIGKAPRSYALQKQSSSDFPYVCSTLSEEKRTISITDYFDFDDTVIKIPSVINGYTVTSIDDRAFYGTDTVEKIIVPDTVTRIGDAAFQQCENLKSVELPNSLESLGKGVFVYDSNLSSISLPASVKELTGGMFNDCQSLKEIGVDENNPYYCSRNGVLFDKSMTTLISYPPGKADAEYSVPEGVTAIEEWAFASCGRRTVETTVTNNGFRKLVLPKSLREIGKLAFCNFMVDEVQMQDGMTAIPSYSFQYADVSRVILPDSVTVIESYAFYRAALKEIILSDSLETIGEAAFAGNLRMKAVLPESVQFIDYGAFWLHYVRL